MYKLVIIIEQMEDEAAFEEGWPQFLHLVERMPGLRLESHSRIEQFLYGPAPVTMQHELYFDSLAAAQQAMASPTGREAGRLLQSLTGGHMTLYLADHKQDDLENILRFAPGEDPAESNS